MSDDLGDSIEERANDYQEDLGEAQLPVVDGVAPRIRSSKLRFRWPFYLVSLFSVLALCAILGREFATPDRFVETSRVNSIAPVESSAASEMEFLAAARESWQSKDYESVVTECTAVLQLAPKNARALLARSSAYSMLSDWDAAIADHQGLQLVDAALSKQKSAIIANAYFQRAKQCKLEALKEIDSGRLHGAIVTLVMALEVANHGVVLSGSRDTLHEELGKLLNRCQRTENAEPGYTIELLKMRRWSDASGKFTTDARFIEISDGHIRLERADGSRCSIEYSKASAQDRILLKGHLSK